MSSPVEFCKTVMSLSKLLVQPLGTSCAFRSVNVDRNVNPLASQIRHRTGTPAGNGAQLTALPESPQSYSSKSRGLSVRRHSEVRGNALSRPVASRIPNVFMGFAGKTGA